MRFIDRIKAFLPQSDSKINALKGLSWLSGDKIFRLAVSFFTGVIVTRYLGKTEYGILSSLTAYAALFSPIANFGVNSILLRDINVHPEKEKGLIDASIFLKGLGGTVAFILSLGLVFLLKQPDYQPLLVFLAVCHFPFYFLESLDIWFLAKRDQKHSVLGGQISFIITSILRMLAVFFNLGLPVVLLTYTLDALLGSVAVFFYARKYLKFRLTEVRFNFADIKQLYKNSIALVFAGIATNMYLKIDKVIMNWLTTPAVIGIYSAATRLSELWYFIPYSISTVFAPMIAEAKRLNPHIYEKRVRKSLIIINVITLLISIATIIIAPLFLALLGKDFSPAFPALCVHIWSLPFISMGMIMDIWLVNEHLQRISVARNFTTAGINILLNYLLVPRFGAVGAAWATLIAYIYPGFLANLFDKRTRSAFWIELQCLFPTVKNIKLVLEK